MKKLSKTIKLFIVSLSLIILSFIFAFNASLTVFLAFLVLCIIFFIMFLISLVSHLRGSGSKTISPQTKKASNPKQLKIAILYTSRFLLFGAGAVCFILSLFWIEFWDYEFFTYLGFSVFFGILFIISLSIPLPPVIKSPLSNRTNILTATTIIIFIIFWIVFAFASNSGNYDGIVITLAIFLILLVLYLLSYFYDMNYTSDYSKFTKPASKTKKVIHTTKTTYNISSIDADDIKNIVSNATKMHTENINANKAKTMDINAQVTNVKSNRANPVKPAKSKSTSKKPSGTSWESYKGYLYDEQIKNIISNLGFNVNEMQTIDIEGDRRYILSGKSKAKAIKDIMSLNKYIYKAATLVSKIYPTRIDKYKLHFAYDNKAILDGTFCTISVLKETGDLAQYPVSLLFTSNAFYGKADKATQDNISGGIYYHKNGKIAKVVINQWYSNDLKLIWLSASNNQLKVSKVEEFDENHKLIVLYKD